MHVVLFKSVFFTVIHTLTQRLHNARIQTRRNDHRKRRRQLPRDRGQFEIELFCSKGRFDGIVLCVFHHGRRVPAPPPIIVAVAVGSRCCRRRNILVKVQVQMVNAERGFEPWPQLRRVRRRRCFRRRRRFSGFRRKRVRSGELFVQLERHGPETQNWSTGARRRRRRRRCGRRRQRRQRRWCGRPRRRRRSNCARNAGVFKVWSALAKLGVYVVVDSAAPLLVDACQEERARHGGLNLRFLVCLERHRDGVLGDGACDVKAVNVKVPHVRVRFGFDLIAHERSEPIDVALAAFGRHGVRFVRFYDRELKHAQLCMAWIERSR
jgi:hypothetical protein